MIESFDHKGLREFFENGKTFRLPQERLKKIKMVLTILDASQELKDLNLPAFRLHKLKKPPLSEYYSIDISGNYRIVFLFEDGKVNKVNYLDTH